MRSKASKKAYSKWRGCGCFTAIVVALILLITAFGTGRYVRNQINEAKVLMVQAITQDCLNLEPKIPEQRKRIFAEIALTARKENTTLWTAILCNLAFGISAENMNHWSDETEEKLETILEFLGQNPNLSIIKMYDFIEAHPYLKTRFVAFYETYKSGKSFRQIPREIVIEIPHLNPIPAESDSE